MASKVLKLTHQDVVIKCWGTDGDDTVTIDLDNLVAVGQVIDGTPTVNIVGLTWTGAPASVAKITRNTTVINTLPGTGTTELDFSGQSMVPDTVENTSDLVVTFSGESQVYIRLRKVAGYSTTVELAEFGPYDNPTVKGS